VVQLPPRFGASAVEQHVLVSHAKAVPAPLHVADAHSAVHALAAGAHAKPSATTSQLAQSPVQALGAATQVPVVQELQLPVHGESQHT